MVVGEDLFYTFNRLHILQSTAEGGTLFLPLRPGYAPAGLILDASTFTTFFIPRGFYGHRQFLDPSYTATVFTELSAAAG